MYVRGGVLSSISFSSLSLPFTPFAPRVKVLLGAEEEEVGLGLGLEEGAKERKMSSSLLFSTAVAAEFRGSKSGGERGRKVVKKQSSGRQTSPFLFSLPPFLVRMVGQLLSFPWILSTPHRFCCQESIAKGLRAIRSLVSCRSCNAARLPLRSREGTGNPSSESCLPNAAASE